MYTVQQECTWSHSSFKMHIINTRTQRTVNTLGCHVTLITTDAVGLSRLICPAVIQDQQTALNVSVPAVQHSSCCNNTTWTHQLSASSTHVQLCTALWTSMDHSSLSLYTSAWSQIFYTLLVLLHLHQLHGSNFFKNGNTTITLAFDLKLFDVINKKSSLSESLSLNF